MPCHACRAVTNRVHRVNARALYRPLLRGASTAPPDIMRCRLQGTCRDLSAHPYPDGMPKPGLRFLSADLTHAMLGVLRLASVPCRYVSGYLYDPGGDEKETALRGAVASHAWVQAWHNELGWVGIDPTNDKLVDWQYVRVSVGRDYSDVQPVRGVFLGTAQQSLEVEVEVQRIG